MVMPTIVYKLNQASSRTKDVPFHKGGDGGNKRPQENAGCPVPQGGGGKHISLCLYNCITGTMQKGEGGGGAAEAQPYIYIYGYVYALIYIYTYIHTYMCVYA